MTGQAAGTTPLWAAVAALLAAAVVVVLPTRSSRQRRFSLFGAVESANGTRSRIPTVETLRHVVTAAPRAVDRVAQKQAAPAFTAAVGAAFGLLTGGPVAAVVVAVYTALLTHAAGRRAANRIQARRRAEDLDQLCALAADLRAGLPPAAAYGAGLDSGTGPSAVRAVAAIRLAEQTGAPLADLVERVEADARALDRAVRAAAAQAAGARATAWLLAVLPAGAIALGYGIGVDPLHVLLRTPIGAVCAMCSVLLQVAGLVWTDRLVNAPARGLDAVSQVTRPVGVAS